MVPQIKNKSCDPPIHPSIEGSTLFLPYSLHIFMSRFLPTGQLPSAAGSIGIRNIIPHWRWPSNEFPLNWLLLFRVVPFPASRTNGPIVIQWGQIKNVHFYLSLMQPSTRYGKHGKKKLVKHAKKLNQITIISPCCPKANATEQDRFPVRWRKFSPESLIMFRTNRRMDPVRFTLPIAERISTVSQFNDPVDVDNRCRQWSVNNRTVIHATDEPGNFFRRFGSLWFRKHSVLPHRQLESSMKLVPELMSNPFQVFLSRFFTSRAYSTFNSKDNPSKSAWKHRLGGVPARGEW